MRQADCIFCKIIAGEIPSNTIYEDDTFKVILDASPASKGHALILPKEMYGELKVGDHVEARVVRVHEDGKLDLSVREKAYLQIETDAEKVMKLIDSFDGVLPFTDKASPEVIRRELAMSKNEFKRAVGNLLKNGRIEITEKAIRRI